MRGNELLLPGPVSVMRTFASLAASERFWLALWGSFYRVAFGMLVSVPSGIAAGILIALDKRIEALLKPVLIAISATPVISVILIAFLWFGQERTPVFTAFLMIFPIITANTIAGINAIDPKLKEVFDIYRLSKKQRLLSLYIPGIAPFVLGALRSGLSLCWKVVVAAEVMVQPARALGTGMQNARAQLETAELYAWTAGTILAAALCQAALSVILGLMQKRR